jgi:predicted Fe-Mo cluster-binding NifX family protein
MMAMVRNASNQPLVLTFGEVEIRFSPQDEKELTDEQLVSEEFKRSESYFVVTSSANDIQEVDPEPEQALANEAVKNIKNETKRRKIN